MDTLLFAPDVLLLLLLISLVAGCLDTLAGGGGLLTLPALILAGLPPIQALATNKLQGSMGTATASLMMLRHRRVAWRDVRWLMLAAFIGAACGSALVQMLDMARLESGAVPLRREWLPLEEVVGSAIVACADDTVTRTNAATQTGIRMRSRRSAKRASAPTRPKKSVTTK